MTVTKLTKTGMVLVFFYISVCARCETVYCVGLRCTRAELYFGWVVFRVPKNAEIYINF